MLQGRFVIIAFPILAVLFAATYFGWPIASFVEAEDSLSFSRRILSGESFLHANHLLFEPAYQTLLQMVLSVLPNADPLIVLQSISAMFGLGALLLVGALVWSRAGPANSLLAVGMVGTFYAFWLYSKIVDAYVPALFFGLLTLWFFQRRAQSPSLMNAGLIALAALAATLTHQMYLFLGAAMVLAIALDRRAGAARFTHAALVLVIGAVGVLGAYRIAYSFAEGDWTSLSVFVAWAMGYAENGLWDTPDAKTPIQAVLGAITTVFTPFPVTEMISNASIPGLGRRSILEELFLTKQALSPGSAWFGLAVMAGVGITYLVFAWQAVRAARLTPFTAFDRLIVALMGMFAVLVILWEAANREFWLHVFVFLAIFVASKIDLSVARRQVTAVVAIGLVGVVNFFMGIQPLSERKNDYFMVMIDHVVEQTQPDDTVVVDCSWMCVEYLKYRPERTWVVPGLSHEYDHFMEGADRVVLIDWTYHPKTPTLTGRPDYRAAFLARLEEVYGVPSFEAPTGALDLPRLQVATAESAWAPIDP